MRYNRLITSVCIFLLELTKIFLGILIVVLIGAALIGKLEAPLGFELGDNYRFEEAEALQLMVNYNGQSYSDITARPKSYFLNLEALPIPGIFTEVPFLLLGLGLWYLLHLIIRLLKSIEEREFFSADNVRRLRIIGFMTISFSILSWAYGHMVKYFLTHYIEVEGVYHISNKFTFNLSFFDTYFFLGLMILLIANAFEHGLRLKQEQELTI